MGLASIIIALSLFWTQLRLIVGSFRFVTRSAWVSAWVVPGYTPGIGLGYSGYRPWGLRVGKVVRGVQQGKERALMNNEGRQGKKGAAVVSKAVAECTNVRERRVARQKGVPLWRSLSNIQGGDQCCIIWRRRDYVRPRKGPKYSEEGLQPRETNPVVDRCSQECELWII